MISFGGEGGTIRCGLNIRRTHTWKRPWIAFIWCWYLYPSRTHDGGTYWQDELHRRVIYFRIRLFMRPFFIFERHEDNVLKELLVEKRLMALTQEEWSWYLPKEFIEKKSQGRWFGL